MSNSPVSQAVDSLFKSLDPSVINSEIQEIGRSVKQRAAIREVLLSNINNCVICGEFSPTDGVLDRVWECILIHTADQNLLMSDVVDGDHGLETCLIHFARTGLVENAANVRARSLYLFRTWAKMESEKEEIHVMDCYRTQPSDI